jgi:16S rRNA (adenine1518-N6/adenine1519-N6)-dimethyltransferase
VADGYLDPSTIRRLAAELDLRPSKQRGQNFLIDANQVRRIVQLAQVGADSTVLEIGPGLGSLTAGLLAAGASVQAVEIEASLARRLPRTMLERQPAAAGRLTVVTADALTLTADQLRAAVGDQTSPAAGAETRETAGGPTHPNLELGRPRTNDPTPTPVESADPTGVSQESTDPTDASVNSTDPDLLVANLPYNVAVPVLLHCLAIFPSLTGGVVMVQREVADRLVASPGGKIYGVPSAKLAWYAEANFAGLVPATVFWPQPRVESGLVRLIRRDPPVTTASRAEVFALIDLAFGQRRKMLRSALSGHYPADRLQAAFGVAEIDPTARGETLAITDFARLAAAIQSSDPT